MCIFEAYSCALDGGVLTFFLAMEASRRVPFVAASRFSLLFVSYAHMSRVTPYYLESVDGHPPRFNR